MKRALFAVFCLLTVLLLPGCGGSGSGASASPSPSLSESPSPSPTPTPVPILMPEGETLETRFNLPEGFARTAQPEDSFGAFLRVLPLKPDGSSAYLFDGTAITGLSPAAVISWDPGTQDRCQNTDALIRLRAEFLFSRERFEDISFHFMSGFNFAFSKWSEGYSIKVSGSKVDWVKSGEPDSSHEALEKYLSNLYVYTNATAILSDLQSASEPSPGDVFVEDGGVMIADLAENSASGETIVMLCKGGGSAQNLYIVGNTREPEISPWFPVSDGGVVYTGSGSFVISALKRFK